MIVRSVQRSRIVADERGASLVVVVLFLPVLILMAAFAIDAANWFTHHSHLQTQADAGALAAAHDFQFPCTPSTEEQIVQDAHHYDGTQTGPGNYNQQLASPPAHGGVEHKVTSLINASNFYNQETPKDEIQLHPCTANAIDVKVTETNLPWYLQALNVNYINAQARVSIEQQTSETGMEPLAVAQSAPLAAKAYFVNEDAGNSVIAESSLGVASNGHEWSSQEAVAVTISQANATSAHIGVVVALSGNTKYPNAAGTLAAKCSEAFVQCFDPGSTGPLLHIAGYSQAGTGSLSTPLARQVTLSKPASPEEACADGYFSNATAPCKFAISAKIDYGAESTNTKGVTVTPVVAGKASATKLVYNAGAKEWTGAATLTPGSGSNEISLLVECKKETGSPCQSANTNQTIKNVQRIYAASSAHSGPITAASVSEGLGGPPDANSFEVCETQDGNSCTKSLAVTIDVAGGLGNAATCETEAACKASNAGFFDPLHRLKVEGNGGTIYECVPEENPSTAEYRKHLAEGCANSYKLNEVTAEGAFSDPTCVAVNPYDCIAVGAKGNHNGAESGITDRIESRPPAGTRFSCANNWQNNNGGKVPIIPVTDSRLVEVFVIPYGAIDENGVPTGGLKAAPITDFATFYVTGFPNDGCKSKAPADDPTSSFEIVGHFIKRVTPSTTGSGSGACSQTSFGNCIAILTK